MKLGLYKHFKGNLYQVLMIVIHSETEEELVIYHPQPTEGVIYARPKAMFTDITMNAAGVAVRRFKHIKGTE